MKVLDPYLARYPIRNVGHIFLLENRKGKRISWHRTLSGALRARRVMIEEQEELR